MSKKNFLLRDLSTINTVSAFLEFLISLIELDVVYKQEDLEKVIDKAEEIECFDLRFLPLLREVFANLPVLETLVERQFFYAASLSTQVKNQKPVNKIAFVCEKLAGGGVERVISLLSEVYTEIGKDVIVITEVRLPNEYKIPETTKRFVVPLSNDRYKCLDEILCSENIDTVVLTDYWRDIAFKTAVWSRLKELNVISQEHNSFFCPIFENALWRFKYRRASYQASHLLTCLNTTDELLWKQSGVANARYVPNPSTFQSAKDVPNWAERGDNVALVSRFCQDKGIQFIPELIRAIANIRPTVRFFLCGWFMSDADEKWFYQEVDRLKVRNYIAFIGRTNQVKAILNQTKVLILPSTHEGSPMVLLEARALAVPSVIFGMHYLDNANRGVVRVPFGRVDLMAKEILSLLSDGTYWNQLSKDAQLGLEIWQKDHLKQVWSDLFDSIHRSGEVKRDEKSFNKDSQFLMMDEFHNSVDYFNSNFSALSESDRVKIGRYDYMMRFVHRFFPDGSWRKNLLRKVLRTLKQNVL